MFISWQTFEDLKITVHLIKEAVKFLLQHHVKYVLTERFCQDTLENYFGQQRAVGAWKDNPSVHDFRFNNNSIRNEKIFWPIAGNVCGQDNGMVDFTNEALACHKKPKKDWIRSCHFVRISSIINSSSNKNGYFNSHT